VVRLGKLAYRAVATPEFFAEHFADGVGSATLQTAPLVQFDRHDTLQHAFIRKVTRRHLAPPASFIPSVREFDLAVRLGMGWGLVTAREVAAEIDDGRLIELVPGKRVEVPLFWQHWKLGSAVVGELTDAIVTEARRRLG
jgi:LysR family transcriptional regulator (chromosome initiation inhibitor)